MSASFRARHHGSGPVLRSDHSLLMTLHLMSCSSHGLRPWLSLASSSQTSKVILRPRVVAFLIAGHDRLNVWLEARPPYRTIFIVMGRLYQCYYRTVQYSTTTISTSWTFLLSMPVSLVSVSLLPPHPEGRHPYALHRLTRPKLYLPVTVVPSFFIYIPSLPLALPLAHQASAIATIYHLSFEADKQTFRQY